MSKDDYTLNLSESELKRYRRMTEDAVAAERQLWADAGIRPGARVADIGSGPGLILAELARMVGPHGSAVGIDANAEARTTAPQVLLNAGVSNAEVQPGRADATGLPPGSFDVVMMRHVLLHNPEPMLLPIVRHVAALLRPGGSLVMAETDGEGVRWERPPHPAVAEMNERYNALLRARGHELSIGPRLGALAVAASLTVETRSARYDVIPPRHDGRRPFAWDSRDALLEAGLATSTEISEWDRALASLGTDTEPLSFLPVFVCVASQVGRHG